MYVVFVILNCLKEFSSLKWFGSSFHVLAAKYLKVLIPYLVVLVDGILAVFWYLKEYLLCLIVIKSWHNFIYLFVLLICDAFEICALSLIIVTF
jgi:apolipoprotein N-acyltransferase